MRKKNSKVTITINFYKAISITRILRIRNSSNSCSKLSTMATSKSTKLFILGSWISSWTLSHVSKILLRSSKSYRWRKTLRSRTKLTGTLMKSISLSTFWSRSANWRRLLSMNLKKKTLKYFTKSFLNRNIRNSVISNGSRYKRTIWKKSHGLSKKMWSL